MPDLEQLLEWGLLTPTQWMQAQAWMLDPEPNPMPLPLWGAMKLLMLDEETAVSH